MGRGAGNTFCRSYLTTEEEPVQHCSSKGLICWVRSHWLEDATPRCWKRVIRFLLADAEGGSETLKAA